MGQESRCYRHTGGYNLDVNYIPYRFPGIHGIRCAFQLRSERRPENPYSGGNISYDVGDDPQSVSRSRKKLQKSLGFESWIELKQVHGDEVVFDHDGNGIEQPGILEADGQATGKQGQALVIKTADCQPILVTHRDGKHVLALHAGWRGNVNQLPTRGVNAFCSHYGLNPVDCFAVRGPSLSPPVAEFTNFEAEFGDAFRDYCNAEKQVVDLWRLTRDQLMAAGIPDRQIFGLDICTFSNPEMCFSYRRKKISGRQASLIWIE